jgi:excinuclease ABC subunit A
MAPTESGIIRIRGARVHNLKNVSLDLPRNKLIVVTGVSGSGKSSLAFDTIYAEGQRRYVESLSSYARQFLERMDKPDVDLIQGISPAMAIEQKTNTRNPRSTVATTTEVYDYLRLLFARVGKTHCEKCGRLVERDTVQTVLNGIAREAEALNESTPKVYLTFPLPQHPRESVDQAVANLKREGFFRLLIDGALVDLNETPDLPKKRTKDIHVLVDRLVFRPGDDHSRFADSIETAFASGGGKADVRFVDSGKILQFNQNFECPVDHIRYEEPDPKLFSFNNPFGACPDCQGFGRAIGIDMDLVVPDRSRALRDGAIQPWTTPKFAVNQRQMLRIARKANLRIDVPFAKLTPDELAIVMDGHDDFDGINGFFKVVERKSYKIYYRVLLSRYRGYTTCPTCGGSRLRKAALNVTVDGKGIADVVAMTITGASRFFESLRLTPHEHEIARRILDEVKKRLKYLHEVGIGYLTLDRLSNTLSGGESQRINLATSLGSSLVGALYVLDEPSIGLHPRDNERLIGILKALRDVGNTVIVVEHDSDMMRSSDIIVDLGPGAGELGGTVVFNGPATAIESDKSSLTGKYLAGRLSIPVPSKRRKLNGQAITIRGAVQNNLKNIDVQIPLHGLVCVTGVSGSGKSTLVTDILYAGLRRRKGDVSVPEGQARIVEGDAFIDHIELVDQSPIGRTPRSNPTTYIGAFDIVRTLFAGTQAAKVHGLTPGHFSFNVPNGRCEACEGDGVIKVEMQFLADLYLPCDACKGKRYKQEVLEIQLHGKNIDDVLNMTVREALQFFRSSASSVKVANKLQVLDDVGLGYIRLGQAATSLSGGEAQRVKLAAHLSAPESGHTLFVFDEPTTGLHFDDIAKLIGCFNALIERGNSVVIIEHNLDVIKCADYIIDLGPEAGAEGGRIVVEGTPEDVAASEASHTGRFLRPYLQRGTQRKKS